MQTMSTTEQRYVSAYCDVIAAVGRRQLERDIIEAAARHALAVHEDSDRTPLTPYGIAWCAASLALVLTDEAHPNHQMAAERHLSGH